MSSLPKSMVLKPSARELEIFSLLERGYNNAQVADHLFISQETVKSHVKHVLGKTLSRNRTQALALLIRREWL